MVLNFSLRVSPATDFFEAIAHRYDRVYALSSGVTQARMLKILRELAPRSRVLDLGVGTGRELTALLDAGHAVTGVDASPSMLARCANRARKIPLVLADFWQPLSFADASFDAVVALHGSLAHPPHEGALGHLAREVLRILAPGGVFIAEVPSPGWLALVDRGEAVGDGMRTVRSGPNRCMHEDLTAGLAVEATILSPAAWQAELGSPFAVTVHELTEVEQLVVARVP